MRYSIPNLCVFRIIFLSQFIEQKKKHLKSFPNNKGKYFKTFLFFSI